MAGEKKFCWTVKGVLDENFPEYVSPRKSQVLPYRGQNGLDVQFRLRFYRGAVFTGKEQPAHSTWHDVPSHFTVCLEVVNCSHAAINAGFKMTVGGPPDIKLVENTPNKMIRHEFDTQSTEGHMYEWQVSKTSMKMIKTVIHKHCPAPKAKYTFLGHLSAILTAPQPSKEDFNVILQVFNVDISLNSLSTLKNPTMEFIDQFWSMYTQKKLIDMTIVVGNKDFGVHKLVLAARSPVFAAMFNHEVTETAQNCLVITDFEATAFDNFIKFLYTGQCDIKENAAELLVCAEKYNVDRLKSECQAVLVGKLKSDNAAFILQLADIHRAPQLKEAALKFICKNTKEVTSTAQWASLSPELLNEIIQYLKNCK